MRKMIVGALLLCSLAALAADKLQPLNVKVGLWETTMTTTTSGTMPIPADLLSRLTPEQRARMEERMKANSRENTRTNTYKSCLTKEQLEKGPDFGDKKQCTQTVITSTSSKAELRVVCDMQDTKASGIMHVEALSPENVKGSGQMSVSGGGHTMNVNTALTGKWIGPNCGDVK
jgi:hypothetical protein